MIPSLPRRPLALALTLGLLSASSNGWAQSSYQFVELKATSLTNSINTQGTQGLAINNAGQTVGLVKKQVGSTFSIFTFKTVAQYNLLPTIWSITGSPKELPITTVSRKVSGHGVHDINSSGQAVGETLFTTFQPTLWSQGIAKALDSREGQALGINDQGMVVGAVRPGTEPFGSLVRHATLWQQGQAADLHAELALSPSHSRSEAVAINQPGQIAINTYLDNSYSSDCYLKDTDGVHKLPVPAGQACQLVALNDQGVAIGHVVNPIRTQSQPAVWIGGQLQWLPTQPMPAGGSPARVTGINTAGVIVGIDQSGPVIWRNNVQTRLTTPIKGLPTTGSKVTGLFGISGDGKLLASIEVAGVARWGLLLPQP